MVVVVYDEDKSCLKLHLSEIDLSIMSNDFREKAVTECPETIGVEAPDSILPDSIIQPSSEEITIKDEKIETTDQKKDILSIKNDQNLKRLEKPATSVVCDNVKQENIGDIKVEVEKVDVNTEKEIKGEVEKVDDIKGL